jgi:hypothetical protein
MDADLEHAFRRRLLSRFLLGELPTYPHHLPR